MGIKKKTMNVSVHLPDDLNKPDFPILSDCHQRKVNLILISDAAGEGYEAQLTLFTKIVDLFSDGQENLERLRVAMAVSGSDFRHKPKISWIFKLGVFANTSDIKRAILQDRWRPRCPTSCMGEAVDFVDGFLNDREAHLAEQTSIVPKLSIGNTGSKTDANESNRKAIFEDDTKRTLNRSNLPEDKLGEGGALAITLIIVIANPRLQFLSVNEPDPQRFRSNKRLLIVFVSSKSDGVSGLACQTIVRNPCITLLAETMLTDHSLSLALCNRCFHDWFGPMPTSEMLANYTSQDYNQALVYTSCYTLIYGENYSLKAAEQCKDVGASLVSIETEDEWSYLNAELMQRCVGGQVCRGDIVAVFLGLRRDTKSLGKRFHWINGRPPIYSKWLDYHPHGGHIHGCTVWDLDLGAWVDLGCGRWMLFTAALCEWTKPTNAKQVKISVPGPPDEQSIARAVSRGQVAFCRLGRDNSERGVFMMPSHLAVRTDRCSLHFNNTGKLQVLHTPLSNRLLFSCHEESLRSIQFDKVCDQVKDCVNNLDEKSDLCNVEPHSSVDMFTCVTSDKQVTMETRCDLYEDCMDGSDEENCDTCQFGLCSDGRCLPQTWLRDAEKDCFSPYGLFTHDLNNSINADIDCAFLCNRSKCVPWSKLGDGVIDCQGPEGPLDETLGTLEQAHCGDEFTMEWAPRCVYQKDRFGELIGCRNMRHLHVCKDFVCPEGYLKCPGAYCIPLHYLQNNEVDCPLGEDETRYENRPVFLLGYFKCDTLNFVFLHPDRVCDGSRDCPHGTDEIGCHVTCAQGFLCGSGFVVVDDYNRSKPLTNISFIDPTTRMVGFSHVNVSSVLPTFCALKLNFLLDLRLSNSSLTDLLVPHRCLPRLSTLDISNNLLRNISTTDSNTVPIYYGAKSLYSLNLSHNFFLEYFDATTLAFNPNLRVLDLSHTAIATFPDMQSVTPSLTHLNLSHTRILQLTAATFPTDSNSWHLAILDLRGTTIEDVESDALRGLKIVAHLYSDSFKLCCPQLMWNIPAHVCHAPRDPLSSCSSLFKDKLLAVLVWIMGLVSVLGNSGVIVTHVIGGRSALQLSHVQLVTHLALSNLLMGVYLLIIASETVEFDGEYVLHDSAWRHSRLCKAAGVFYSLSSVLSPLFILLIIIDRYLVIKYPVSQRRLSSAYIFTYSIIAWWLGLALAAIPLLPWANHWNADTSNAACLGFPLLRERRPGWQFLTAVFIALNCLLCVSIALGQMKILRAASATRKATSTSHIPPSHSANLSTKLQKELALTTRLTTVSATNLFCWLLADLTGFLVLGGHDLRPEAYAWIALFLLPLTSALNPVLYSLPFIRHRLAKAIARCMASRRKGNLNQIPRRT